MKIGDAFSSISRKASNAAGSWQAFIAATGIVVVWLIGGFFFGFLDPVYQLVINTFTTCITFVMVFLIQSASNRDQKSLQIKLSEIISVLEKADNRLINIEDATDDQIAEAREKICANSDNTPD